MVIGGLSDIEWIGAAPTGQFITWGQRFVLCDREEKE